MIIDLHDIVFHAFNNFLNLQMFYNKIYVFGLQLTKIVQLGLTITVMTSSSERTTSSLKCSKIRTLLETLWQFKETYLAKWLRNQLFWRLLLIN